jgi:hypothetical protein
VNFSNFCGDKNLPNFFLYQEIEEKPCPNDHNLKKRKNEKRKKKFPSEKGKEDKRKEMKRKEKLLTCLIHPLLERTKIPTGKKKKTQAFLSFLFFP